MGKIKLRTKQVRALGAFLFRAWIDHQQLYYFDSRKKNDGRSKIYETCSAILLIATFVIACVYGFGGYLAGSKIFGWLEAIEWLGEGPHIMAVVFPAITSALAGIMIFHHFARNAERYSSMSNFLWGIGAELLTAVGLSGNEQQIPDLERLRLLVRNADRAMAHEHEGWRTVFGVKLPGPG